MASEENPVSSLFSYRFQVVFGDFFTPVKIKKSFKVIEGQWKSSIWYWQYHNFRNSHFGVTSLWEVHWKVVSTALNKKRSVQGCHSSVFVIIDIIYSWWRNRQIEPTNWQIQPRSFGRFSLLTFCSTEKPWGNRAYFRLHTQTVSLCRHSRLFWPYDMDRTIWSILSGPYEMFHVKWSISYGLYRLVNFIANTCITCAIWAILYAAYETLSYNIVYNILYVVGRI